MSGLYALTYTSEARLPLLRSQIDHILLRSRERNPIQGVTGVLLYSDGKFMQYLEGPKPGLEEIFGIIKADSLHHRIVEEELERIWVREFEQWSMAFRSGGTYGMSHPMQLDALLSGRLIENMGSSSTSIQRIFEFWTQCKGLRAF